MKRSIKRDNELKVSLAISSEDEIRFFFDKKEYVSAVKCDDGEILVKYGHLNEKNYKKFEWKLPDMVELVIQLITIAILCIYINNIIIVTIVANLVIFIAKVTAEIVIAYTMKSKELKNMHSAEHMIANFMEKNKRLPNSIKELKNSSRFHKNCGSRKRINEIIEEQASILISIVLTFFISSLCVKTESFVISILALAIIYVFVGLIVKICIEVIYNKLENYGKEITIKPLNILLQYFITSKDVPEMDLLIAYVSAKKWMNKKYPQFYTENKERDKNFLKGVKIIE